MFGIINGCESTSMLMDTNYPKDSNEHLYGSQALHNRASDLRYESGFDTIPTSEQITEKLDSYLSPKFPCEHTPEIGPDDLEEAHNSQFEKMMDKVSKEVEKEVEGLLSFDDTQTAMKNNFKKLGGDPLALEQALCFLGENEDAQFKSREGKNLKIKNNNFMVIQDFTKPSSDKRFFLINRNTGYVEVMSSAHGMGQYPNGKFNSPVGVPEYFSNKPGSKLTPRGFMLSAEYSDSNENWDWNMRFDGLQKGINDNTRRRAVVFHAGYKKSVMKKSVWGGKASCLEEKPELKSESSNGETYGKGIEQGMTEGCTSVAPEFAKDVYEKTKNGALFYNYTQAEKDLGPEYCGDNLMY